MSKTNQLNAFDILGDAIIDSVIAIGKHIFEVEHLYICGIGEDNNLVDVCHGMVATSKLCDMPFFIDTILFDASFLVEDTCNEPRWSLPPLFVGEDQIRFCAGSPLRKLDDRCVFGAIIIMDTKPRQIGVKQFKLLHELAAIIAYLLIITNRSTHDALTNLLNRDGFMGEAKKILQQHYREKTSLVLLFMDIDGFKTINDNFGHHEGDYALIMFSNVLNEIFRSYDVCARIGGDEFAVLVPHSSLCEGLDMISRLTTALMNLTKNKQLPYSLRCSVGITCYDGNQEPDLERLLSSADQDMYRKKQRG